MGPIIVTRDEVPDPQNVQVKLWLNGELRQDYNTGSMTQPVAAQIGWLSQCIMLQPGDVVSCGTHHVGLSPINEGDRVEVEGQGLGRLHFSVKSYGPRKDAFWGPPGVRQVHGRGRRLPASQGSAGELGFGRAGLGCRDPGARRTAVRARAGSLFRAAREDPRPPTSRTGC